MNQVDLSGKNEDLLYQMQRLVTPIVKLEESQIDQFLEDDQAWHEDY